MTDKVKQILEDPALINEVRVLRMDIEDIVKRVVEIKKLGIYPHKLQEGKSISDQGEMAANVALALRHLEDARMRLGKVIQAYDGGVSCY